MKDHPPFPGTRAPHFSLPRTAYESVALSDVHGYPAVLVFYPGDWEPVSDDQLAHYQLHLSELQRFGATLVGISVDSIWSHAAFRREVGLTFPLLSDAHPKGAVSRADGACREDAGWSSRAVVVIDRQVIVTWSRTYPTNLDPGLDGILTALERMLAQEKKR